MAYSDHFYICVHVTAAATMPYTCGTPYDRSNSSATARLKSCVKSETGKYANLQQCVESCYINDAAHAPMPAARRAKPVKAVKAAKAAKRGFRVHRRSRQPLTPYQRYMRIACRQIHSSMRLPPQVVLKLAAQQWKESSSKGEL